MAQLGDQGGWVLTRADCSGVQVRIDTLPFVVGRGSACSLQLKSQQVSRLHARFVATSVPQCLFLEDGKSANGTFVNGVRFSEPVPVGDGDLIRFAEEDWTLEALENEPVSAPTMQRFRPQQA